MSIKNYVNWSKIATAAMYTGAGGAAMYLFAAQPAAVSMPVINIPACPACPACPRTSFILDGVQIKPQGGK